MTLDSFGVSRIYLRYFDVEYDEFSHSPKPTYFLDEISDEIRDMEIIPVVYLENEVLKKGSLDSLANKIAQLVIEISTYHFKGKEILRLQVDCDWTESTRENYFEILRSLSKDFVLESTIRLHQIKYQNKTGIPPVKRGVLMLYNMGNLADMEQNSILSLETTASYLNSSSTYPLPLALALPQFSQTVIKSSDDRIKLINDAKSKELDKNSECFKKISQYKYLTSCDTTFHGHVVRSGFEIKVEEPSVEEIIRARDLCLSSNLEIDEYILYHLDTKNVNTSLIRKFLH